MSVIASAVRTYIQHDVHLVVKTIKTLTDNAECMHMCIISRRAHNSLRDALATLEFLTVRLVASAADCLSYSSAVPCVRLLVSPTRIHARRDSCGTPAGGPRRNCCWAQRSTAARDGSRLPSSSPASLLVTLFCVIYSTSLTFIRP
jgi:hypothetical protein